MGDTDPNESSGPLPSSPLEEEITQLMDAENLRISRETPAPSPISWRPTPSEPAESSSSIPPTTISEPPCGESDRTPILPGDIMPHKTTDTDLTPTEPPPPPPPKSVRRIVAFYVAYGLVLIALGYGAVTLIRWLAR